MADHVRVGEVADENCISGVKDGLDQPIADFGRGHFGLQVVGRDLGTGDEDTVFAGVRRFDPTVGAERLQAVYDRVLAGDATESLAFS